MISFSKSICISISLVPRPGSKRLLAGFYCHWLTGSQFQYEANTDDNKQNRRDCYIHRINCECFGKQHVHFPSSAGQEGPMLCFYIIPISWLMEFHAISRSCWETASPVVEAKEERSSILSREPEPRLLFRALPMPHLSAKQTEDTQKSCNIPVSAVPQMDPSKALKIVLRP